MPKRCILVPSCTPLSLHFVSFTGICFIGGGGNPKPLFGKGPEDTGEISRALKEAFLIRVCDNMAKKNSQKGMHLLCLPSCRRILSIYSKSRISRVVLLMCCTCGTQTSGFR